MDGMTGTADCVSAAFTVPWINVLMVPGSRVGRPGVTPQAAVLRARMMNKKKIRFEENMLTPHLQFYDETVSYKTLPAS
jgi:hypothetical protein